MKIVLSLMLNCEIPLGVIAGLLVCFVILRAEKGTVEYSKTFRFFTTDSNILAAISAVPVIVYDLIPLSGGQVRISQWALCFKFVGTLTVAVTFLTCLLFLGPTQGYKNFYLKDGFFMHLLNPLCAIISFIFFDSDQKLQLSFAFIGAVPVLIYACVYLYMVIGRGENNEGWKDFYGFNIGGRWYISFAAMVIISFFLGLGLIALHNIAV